MSDECAILMRGVWLYASDSVPIIAYEAYKHIYMLLGLCGANDEHLSLWSNYYVFALFVAIYAHTYGSCVRPIVLGLVAAYGTMAKNDELGQAA